MAANANVDDKGAKADCTPLMEAASAGNVDVVNLLIEQGADVNAKSAAGKLPSNHYLGMDIIGFQKGACFQLSILCEQHLNF